MSFEEIKSFLPESRILTDADSLKIYGKDWLNQYPSSPSIVVFPKTTDEVVKLVEWARKHKTPLVPSGGRTGLSGGASARNKEVIVSFEKMNQILEWNEAEGTLLVEAGVITHQVQSQAKEHGFLFPISFAAEGSSQIGGNIATNAGGVHVIRYGMMRNWVQGLEVVTGRGEVLRLGRSLIKDAAGYNFLHLFIGSEGTLGFITKATLAVSRRPSSSFVMLLGVSDLKHLIDIYSQFKKSISLHAFEMFTDQALDYVKALGKTCPLSQKYPYYILIEALEKEQEEALNIFEKLLNDQKIADGFLNQSSKQAQEVWALRENISEALAPYEPYKNDISVRISKLPDFLNHINDFFKTKYPDYKVIWFGHIGDGNLHINILKPENMEKDHFVKHCEEVSQVLFSKIQEFKGSISAEHGVGLLKKNYLQYSRSKEEIEYMRKIKNIFDPDKIMNPGKIFDS